MLHEHMLTPEQEAGLRRLWDRGDKKQSFGAFRDTAYNDAMLGCLMVKYKGILVGIEKDGYTHS